MTLQEIISMAREAGALEMPRYDLWQMTNETLERFFNIAFAAGAAHEREKQAEQEPVAYAGMLDGSVCAVYTQWPISHYHEIKPLYAAPVRTKDLTDDEIDEIGKSYFDEWSFGFARAVIDADREKNK